MSDVIQFSCPQCHGETFKVGIEVKRLEDFDGAVCTGCGRTIGEKTSRIAPLRLLESSSSML